MAFVVWMVKLNICLVIRAPSYSMYHGHATCLHNRQQNPSRVKRRRRTLWSEVPFLCYFPAMETTTRPSVTVAFRRVSAAVGWRNDPLAVLLKPVLLPLAVRSLNFCVCGNTAGSRSIDPSTESENMADGPSCLPERGPTVCSADLLYAGPG